MGFRTLLCLILIGVSGCTRKNAPSTNHENGKTQNIQNIPAVKTANEIELEKWDPLQIREAMKSSYDNIESQIRSLAGFILNENTLRDQKVVNTERFSALLELFNWGLLQLAEKKPEVFKEFKGTYQKAALQGCNSELKGCELMSVFRIDHQSATILQKIADDTKDLQEYYRLLSAALDISGRQILDQIKVSYLKRSDEYADFLKTDPQFTDKLAKHKKTLSLLMEGSAKSLGTYLAKRNPWAASNQDSGLDGIHFTVLRQYLRSADAEAAKKNKLKEFLGEQKKKPEDFKSQQEAVKSEFSAPWTALKMTEVTEESLEYYLTDRLFYGHLSSGQALEIASSLRVDFSKLAVVAEDYLRVHFFVNMMDANKLMSKALGENFQIDDFLNRAISRGSENGVIWRRYIGRTASVEIFIDALLKGQSPGNQTLAEAHKRIGHIKHNIKVYSVYPHMLVVGYFMARYNFSKVFRFLWWEFTTPATEVIRALMNAKEAPWFDYGVTYGSKVEDYQPITRFEMVKALEMALKSGLFKIFKIDAGDFIAEILKNFLSMYSEGTYLESGLNNNLEELQKSQKSNRGVKALADICADLSSGRTPSLSQNFYNVSQHPFFLEIFEAFKYEILPYKTPGPSPGLSPVSSAQGARVLEASRLGVKPSLHLTKMIAQILETHLKEEKIEASVIATTMSKINRPIEELEKKSKGFADLFSQTYKNYASCMPRLVEFSKKGHRKMMQAVENFSREVYKKHLASPKDALAFIQANTSSAPYVSRASLTDQRLTLHSYDIYSLIKRELEKEFPTLHYQVPESLGDERVAASASNRSFTLPLAISENDFVTQMAVRVFGINDDGFLQWYRPLNSLVEKWIYWPQVIVALHRWNPAVYPLDQVFAAMESIAQMSGVNDEDEKVFTLTGRRSWLDDSKSRNAIDSIALVDGMDYIKSLFYDSSRVLPRGMFDQVIRQLMFDIQGGWDHKADEAATYPVQDLAAVPDFIFPVTVSAREFATYKQQEKLSIFNFSSTVDDDFQNYFLDLVKEWKTNAEDFLRATSEMNSGKELRLSLTNTELLSPISEGVKDQLYRRWEIFDKETNRYYSK